MGFERDPPRRSDFQEGEDKNMRPRLGFWLGVISVIALIVFVLFLFNQPTAANAQGRGAAIPGSDWPGAPRLAAMTPSVFAQTTPAVPLANAAPNLESNGWELVFTAPPYQNNPNMPFHFYNMTFASRDLGFAYGGDIWDASFGNQGRIYRTTDGGQTWNKVLRVAVGRSAWPAPTKRTVGWAARLAWSTTQPIAAPPGIGAGPTRGRHGPALSDTGANPNPLHPDPGALYRLDSLGRRHHRRRCVISARPTTRSCAPPTAQTSITTIRRSMECGDLVRGLSHGEHLLRRARSAPIWSRAPMPARPGSCRLCHRSGGGRQLSEGQVSCNKHLSGRYPTPLLRAGVCRRQLRLGVGPCGGDLPHDQRLDVALDPQNANIPQEVEFHAINLLSRSKAITVGGRWPTRRFPTTQCMRLCMAPSMGLTGARTRARHRRVDGLAAFTDATYVADMSGHIWRWERSAGAGGAHADRHGDAECD